MRAKVKRWVFLGVKVALIAVPILLIVSFGFVEYTSRPSFCKSCHIMEQYYESWQMSSHHEVPCLECHYPPGIEATVRSKAQAISQVAKYFTGSYGTKPWAEISDDACLRSGCHSDRLIRGQVMFKGVLFDHEDHLTELRRGKKLRCTSCHSQIVQGEHITVTETTCFLCHFKNLPEGQSISGCSSCHTTPKGIVKLEGIEYDHQDMAARGVACEKCHSDVTVGDGAVPLQRCSSCHIEPERLARHGDSVFLHQKHVTDHSVECGQCHLDIQHRIAKMTAPMDTSCQDCHPDHHAQEKMMYMGIGGKQAVSTPSEMYKARVACKGCHIDEKHTSQGNIRVAQAAACMNCHGPAYTQVQEKWTQTFHGLLDQLHPGIQQVALVLDQQSKTASEGQRSQHAKQLYEDALHNIELVQYGQGVHNPTYAKELLNLAHDWLNQALQELGSQERLAELLTPEISGAMPCAKCHTDIEQKVVSYGGKPFPHDRHLKAQLACSICHSGSPLGETDHGTTHIGPDDCGQCHHITSGLDCQTCHANLEQITLVSSNRNFEHRLHKSQDCSNCHAQTATRKLEKDCTTCHHDSKIVEKDCAICHPAQSAMYRGTQHQLPSLMYEAKVTCQDCHALEVQPLGKATSAGCVNAKCHADGNYALTMSSTQNHIRSKLEQLEAELKKVHEPVAMSDDAAALDAYLQASANLEFVRNDNTLGIHNPELADRLLADTEVKLKKCAELTQR